MKTIFQYSKTYTLLTILAIVGLSGCERDLSEDAEFATNPTTAEIFTDNFVGLGEDFFFPFVGDGAKPDVFEVDTDVHYAGSASLRFDVPNSDDPSGNFVGANFIAEGIGRNLTDFDALTFWARSTEGAPVEIGFGLDGTRVAGLFSLSTAWTKYVIPIPDPSILVNERGVLNLSAGTQHNGGFAYSFWLDEVRFEKLGTIGQMRPFILNGTDVALDSFNGVSQPITGLGAVFNLGSGIDQSFSVGSSYFQFDASNPGVASVGNAAFTVNSAGTSVITAQVAGVLADGSLTINSLGNFTSAPQPPARDPGSVISIFSDAYANVAVDYYNGFFAPFQTTLGGAINVAGDNVISYTDLNFVGIGTFVNVPSVNASSMTHLHVDINVQEAIDPGDFIILRLLNSVGNNETSGDYTISGDQLTSQGWASFDIPLGDFTGPADKSQLGLYFFVSDGTISKIFVDNYYFYIQ